MDAMEPEQRWQYQVQDALESVQGGQHLRFINSYFLTKEVCLAALRHESSHNDRPYDIGAVPAAHLDYVVEKIKEEYPTRTPLHEFLERRMRERKERASELGYYSHDSLQLTLEHHQVATWDDMLRKLYLENSTPTEK